jgi:predicted transposase/invertase (TIGR01784 family)
MRTDSILYRFFKSFPSAFFRMIGEDESKAKYYSFESIEVKDIRYCLDGIFKPQKFHMTFYFTEFQFQRVNLYSRFFAEIFVVLDKYKIRGEWMAVVIYPSRKMDLGVDKAYEDFLITKRLKRIYLDELPNNLIDSFPLNLFKIITTEENKVRKAVNEVVTKIPLEVTSKIDREKFGELLFSVILSKLSKITIEEVKEMLKPALRDVRKSRAARQLIHEGRLEGKLEGKFEGKIETARTMLKDGISINKIMKYTGLEEKEISNLSSD